MSKSPFKMPGFSGFKESMENITNTVTSGLGAKNNKKPNNNELIALLQEENTKKEEVDQAINTRNNKETLI